MKYFLIFGLVFLMVGCKAITGGSKSPSLPTIVVSEAETQKKEPVVSTFHKGEDNDKIPVPSLPPSNTVPSTPPKSDAVKTVKPILCGPMKDVLSSMMKDYDEEPFVTWQDAAHGFPVMLLINKKTRTSTLLEYPGFRNDAVYHENACIISVGINTKILRSSSLRTHINLIEK